MDIKILAVLIALFCVARTQLDSSDDDYCYSEEIDPYLLANTKTPYHIIHGSIENTTVAECQPIQIWMLIRHGTRNPDEDEVESMIHRLPELQRCIIENHEKYGNGSLCQEDLDVLRKWKMDSNLKEDEAEYLTTQGEIDLSTVGERFSQYYPELLRSEPVDSLRDRYKFRSTDTQRTVASMENFIYGAFGNVTIDNKEVVPTAEDTLLKLYKTCKPWLKELKKPYASAEVNKYLAGSEVAEVIASVSKRLGFAHSLSYDDVLTMYNVCAFENAWNIYKRSAWCAPFRKEDLKVFEYETDLYYYYHTSYGQSLAPKVGCPPLKDMFTHFTKLENNDTSEEPQGIFYFTHSSAVQLFLSTIGIAKDTTPLTAANYQAMSNRKWSTSHLVPFAANFAAVLYKCDSSNKVKLLLNEHPLEFEGCEEGLCDWDHLKKKLGPIADSCNMDYCTK